MEPRISSRAVITSSLAVVPKLRIVAYFAYPSLIILIPNVSLCCLHSKGRSCHSQNVLGLLHVKQVPEVHADF